MDVKQAFESSARMLLFKDAAFSRSAASSLLAIRVNSSVGMSERDVWPLDTRVSAIGAVDLLAS